MIDKNMTIIEKLAVIYRLTDVEISFLMDQARDFPMETGCVLVDILSDEPTEFPALTSITRAVRLLTEQGSKPYE